MDATCRTRGRRAIAVAPTWGAIFDVDGTMVDNRAYHEGAWIEYGKLHDFPITAEFYSEHLHSKSSDDIARFLYGAESDTALVTQVTDEKEALYRELYRPNLAEIQGFTRLVADLKTQGIPCGAVSNSPHPNIDMVLNGLDVRDAFDVVLSFTDVTHSKPHPELFLTAADKLGLPMDRCIVFEDSPSGFAGAEAAGAPYVVVTSGADPDHLHKAARAAADYPDFMTITVAGLEGLLNEVSAGAAPGA